jgi:hypothetical protein
MAEHHTAVSMKTRSGRPTMALRCGHPLDRSDVIWSQSGRTKKSGYAAHKQSVVKGQRRTEGGEAPR